MSSLTPLIIFFIIFFINGLGFFPQQINLWMWVLVSVAFLPKFRFYLNQAKKLRSVVKISYILFFFAGIVSLIESIDLINSLLYLYFYLFLGAAFLEGFSIEKTLRKQLVWILLGIGLIFVLFEIVLHLLLNRGNTWLLPQHGYQLVYAKFTNHNHLGDYLSVVMALLLGMILTNKKWLIPFLLCLPVFILSFSRSAYLSFLGSAIWVAVYFKGSRLTKLVIGGFCLLLVAVVLGVAFETRQLPGINSINYVLRQNGLVAGKAFSGSRIYLLSQAETLFFNRPLTGYGIGNYPQAVTLDLEGKNLAYTSHNIFADILVETGLLGLSAFILLIISLLKHSQKKSPFFLAAVALFINFQTDYTFRIFGMLLLFTLLISISVGGKTNGHH